MDSPTITVSTGPNPDKRKGGKSDSPDAREFSISLDMARSESGGTSAAHGQGEDVGDGDSVSISMSVSKDETGGGAETTTITIEGLGAEGASGAEGGLTVEIETVSFSGEDLAMNLSASTVLNDGVVAQTANGSFGVEGSVSGSADVRLEVGETLTFTMPPAEGEVVGGQVTITNLFGSGEEGEGALIFAYDAEDRQLACYAACGNETGTVTVDIDVSFARLDFKAIDNATLYLQDNSNFAIGNVGVKIASFVGDVVEGAGELVADLLSRHDARLIDFGHTGTVNFEINRISVNKRSTLDILSTVDADQEKERLRRRPELDPAYRIDPRGVQGR